MSEVKITKSTLVPISLTFAVSAGSFWLASLFKDVEANAADLRKLSSERSSFEAELIQRMNSQEVTIGQVETKITLLLKWADEDRKRGK